MDKRPFVVSLFDPFDIGGLITGGVKGPKFWEDGDSNRDGNAREDGAILADRRVGDTKA